MFTLPKIELNMPKCTGMKVFSWLVVLLAAVVVPTLIMMVAMFGALIHAQMLHAAKGADTKCTNVHDHHHARTHFTRQDQSRQRTPVPISVSVLQPCSPPSAGSCRQHHSQ